MDEAIQEAVAASPRGALRAVVAEHHGYRQRGVRPARHLGLPSPYLTVIFALDEPLHLAQHVDPTQSPGQYLTLIGGLHSTPAVVEHDGAQSGIQVLVSPLGARALFGMPAGELAGVDVAGDVILGRLASELQERLRAATTWPARFALLDRVLGERLGAGSRPEPEIRRAWQLLLASRGRVDIATIAQDVGWSARHLERRFRVELGLTPKLAARVIRFDRARRMLPFGTGADIAACCGYADQSHLVRDMIAFTGLNPRAYLAHEVGNLQVTPSVLDADWAS